MDNKLIGGVVVLVLVIAGGWYLLSSGPAPSGQPAAVAAASGTGTLGDLLAMGDTQCQVTVDEGNGEQGQGTVYVSSGKMSGDFSTMVGASTTVAHMINDGAYVYTWSDMVPQGVKMPVPAPGAAASSTTSQGVSTGSAASYSCAPWTADENKFVPPASVTFMDLQGMMPAAQ